MGVKFKVYDSGISIWTESKKNYIERIPNAIIWSINTLLAQQYVLYEYYIVNKSDLHVAQNGMIYTVRKCEVAFCPLDSEMISHRTPNKKELSILKEQYNPGVDDMSFDEYIDIAMLEMITETHYFACDSKNDVDRLMVDSPSHSYKEIMSRIKSEMPICIDIEDHDRITVTSNKPELLRDVEAIVVKSIQMET